MRIDYTHRKWALWTAIIFGVALVAYVPYALLSQHGASGGSLPGLIYGVIGYAMMVFAVLLGLRKKYPIWRIGRTQTWMRGHLWLGLVSYPIIIFHAGLRFGHGLAFVMMWLFTLVIVTGVFGAILQHFMPRIMTERVPMETLYDQIGRVQKQLVKEADELMQSISDTNSQYGLLVPSSATKGTATSLLSVEFRAAVQVRGVYEKQMRNYLTEPGPHGHEIADRKSAKAAFNRLRTLAPQSIHPLVDDLENICEEKRDLDRQSRMHKLLHGWLLAHIPISIALVIMGAIHAVIALRY